MRWLKGCFIFGSIFVLVLLALMAFQIVMWLFPAIFIAVMIYASITADPKT